MTKRNLTITLQPRIDRLISDMYEAGLINSKSQLVEMAILEWLQRHEVINLKEELESK